MQRSRGSSNGPDLYDLLCRAWPRLRWRQPRTRELLRDFTGCVRNGEMMLVLGRPGAGCTRPDREWQPALGAGAGYMQQVREEERFIRTRLLSIAGF